MKRKMKQFITIVLATAMMLAMTVTAFAANTGVSATVTVKIANELRDHKFVAYQIFKGTQETETTTENATTTTNITMSNLGDVDWGTGVDGESFLSDLQSMTIGSEQNKPFKDCETAEDVANVLKDEEDNSDLAKAFAKLAYEYSFAIDEIDDNIIRTELSSQTTELPIGYYLIVDITPSLPDGDAYNTSLLQLTGKDDIEISLKTDAPEVVKKVTENEKEVSNQGDKFSYDEGENDVADYNINDEVPFTFYSKVPDMENYDSYTYILHDTMTEGLTFDENSVVVEIEITKKELDGTTTNEMVKLTKGTDYTVTKGVTHGEGEEAKTCSFDLKILGLKEREDVEAGALIKVTYTATLNEKAVIGLAGNANTVYLEYSNNPNDEEETGNTPKDTVIVFTYELDVDKVDGDTLGDEGNVITTGDEQTKHLKDAEFVLYREVEKTIPGENGGDNTTETVKEYVTVDDDNKVTGWTNDKDEATRLKSDDDGLFSVIGLDDGTYYLEETKAPNGYNLLKAPIEVVVSAETLNNAEWTNGKAEEALKKLEVTSKVGTDGEEVDGTTSVKDGTASIVVANNKGVLLPETGSVGTTLLYIVGILAMAGGVFYFTMNRKKKEN